jgi:hypothetical protein
MGVPRVIADVLWIVAVASGKNPLTTGFGNHKKIPKTFR